MYELSQALRLAHQAQTVAPLRQPRALARFLYHRWYLGQAAPHTIPRQHRPHMWRSWSDSWQDGSAPRGEQLVRLHLACTPHTALLAVTLATEHARTWDAPWQLVSTAMSSPVSAPDATVLFVPISELDRLRPAIDALVADAGPLLSSVTPPMTLRVGPGASLAQNPADGGNFGKHRCRIISEIALATHDLSRQDQLAAAKSALLAQGIDPGRPYLHSTVGVPDLAWAAA
ncbi:MAG: T3SS effector HopA1 family protein [Nocardioidaceae bacterium]